MGNLEVIDRDDSLWVLNKPSGLLSAPGRGPDKLDCLLRRVQALDPTVRLVHRLDQAQVRNVSSEKISSAGML